MLKKTAHVYQRTEENVSGFPQGVFYLGESYALQLILSTFLVKVLILTFLTN